MRAQNQISQPHPSTEELILLLLGEQIQNLEAIELHVTQCEWCAELLTSLDAQQVEASPKLLGHLQRLGEPNANETQDDSPPQTSQYSQDLPEIPGYEILNEIGRGGMGVVYQARQVGLNRVVALKMILQADYAGSAERMRFEREAQAIAQLDHPNIVQIFEINSHEGKPFFSLEFVTGGSLDHHLNEKPMSAKDAARLVECLARGIQVAHKANVIHRDLKPANVLLTEEGVPKITDFGLAKNLDEAGQTQSGGIVGTPSYMAPEQAAGKSQELGAGVDIHALGAILYECLTGRPPFRGVTVMETLQQVISRSPTPPSKLQERVSNDLETICLKCLEKEPARRYESAELLADDLRRYQNGEPILARSVGRTEKAWRWCKRNPTVASLLLLVMLTLVSGSVISTWFAIEASQRAENEAIEKNNTKRANGELKKALTRLSLQREQTEAQRHLAVLRLYSSQLAQAQREWRDNNQVAARDFLDACQWDLRNVEHRLLRSLYEGDHVALRGHEGSVFCVALSPDGKRIASGGQDKTVKVWDAFTGRELLSLKGHTGFVGSVCFSPDSKRIVSSSNGIKLWDAATGRLILTFNQSSDPSMRRNEEYVYCARFSPDGSRILSGSAESIAELWDAATGKKILTLEGHSGAVQCVAFSPDGKYLVSGSKDKTVKVWEALTGQELHTLKGHGGLVRDVAFSPDGKRIVSGSGDSTVKVWDIGTGRESLTLKGHSDAVGSVCFSPDGRRIGSSSREIILWDAVTGREIRTFKRTTWGSIGSICFSPDGKKIVSGGSDQAVRVWDLTGQETLTLEGHSQGGLSVAVNPSSTRVVSAGRDRTIQLWNAVTGQKIFTIRGHRGRVTSVTFSPDGKQILSGSFDDTVKLWSAHTGKAISTFRGNTRGVLAVAFSPDGKRVASAGGDTTVRVWDIRKSRKPRILRGDRQPVMRVSFSPDGERIVSGSIDGTVRIWDVATGRPIHILKRHKRTIGDVVFSPDGNRVASAAGEIKLWDAKSGREIITFKGHGAVQSLAFSPDGTRIVSGSSDHGIRIWDTATGQALLTLREHDGNVTSVAFSADGNFLVSGSGDNTVKVWDATFDRDRFTLEGQVTGIERLGFSSDGKRIVGIARHAKSYVWNAKTGNLLQEMPPEIKKEKPQLSPDGRHILVKKRLAIQLEPIPLTQLQIAQKLARMNPGPKWHQRQGAHAAQSGDPSAESFHLKWQLQYQPWRTDLHIRRARLLEKLRRPLEALQHYLIAGLQKPDVALVPRDPKARLRGIEAAQAEKWQEAVEAFSVAVRQPNATVGNWNFFMLCQLANHDVRGYRESVSTALEYFSHTVSSKARFSLLHCCTLVASAPKESDRLIKLAEEQVRSQRNTKTLNLLGIANYHAGNHEKAMQTFHAALKAEGKAGKVTAFLFLARILHQQQKWDESQKWMKKVEAWAARMTPQNWRHKVRWQIWLSEARRELAIFPPMPKAKR